MLFSISVSLVNGLAGADPNDTAANSPHSSFDARFKSSMVPQGVVEIHDHEMSAGDEEEEEDTLTQEGYEVQQANESTNDKVDEPYNSLFDEV